jgi:hypothetical protein
VPLLGVAELLVSGGGVTSGGGERTLRPVGVLLGAGGLLVGFSEIQLALVQFAL